MTFLPLAILLPFIADAQVSHRDTASFYRDLYHYSKEHPLLYTGYRALFNVPPDPVNPQAHNAAPLITIPDSLEGHFIHSISIIVLEPFGYELSDTAKAPRSVAQRAGNDMHMRTRNAIVKRYLMFEEGEPLDLFKIKESERLLRQSQFVRDAQIYADAVGYDSVDVRVYVQDLWTFEVSFVLTAATARTRFTEYNFLGLGHRFRNKVEYNSRVTGHPFLLDGSYYIPNIEHSFISAYADYKFSIHDDRWGIRFDRPFFSPLTNWAGGIFYGGQKLNDSLLFNSTYYAPFKYESNNTGVWVGRSFRIRQGKSVEEQSTRFVVSGSYSKTRYPVLQTDEQGVRDFFKASNRYLAGIGYSSRKYYVDRFIYEYGEKEDVPAERSFQLTGGLENNAGVNRFYGGVMAGASGYISREAYLSGKIEAGSFINTGSFYRGVINGKLFGFSGLYSFNDWHLRLYGFAQYTYGFGRLANERISLSENEGIPGYSLSTPMGTSRFTMSARLFVFNPFHFWGFSFTPVLFAGMGMTGDNNHALVNSKVYPCLGGGFAISNYYLIHSNFELLFGWYPQVPGSENSRYRINPSGWWGSSFEEFTFGQPAIIPFE